MAEQMQHDVRPVLKRPRPVLSCLECRRKKLKCDRLLPCQQCLKLNQPSLCSYAPGQEPELRSDSHRSESTPKRACRDTSEDTARSSADVITDLHDRVRRLEQSLRLQERQTSSPTLHHSRTLSRSSSYSTPYTALDDSTTTSAASAYEDVDFCIFKKFPDAVRFSHSLVHRLHQPEIYAIQTQLHTIHNAVTRPPKTRPLVLSSYTHLPELLYHMIQLLPPIQVRNKLVELYFENFEHCVRVLHKPNFLTRTQKYNQGVLDQISVDYFVPTLIGVLCIASNLNTYPECDIPQLHGKGAEKGAIQLMNNWYELVISRDGATIAAIEVKMLSIQMQKYQNTDAADLWVQNAQLVRQAMTQHLHRLAPVEMCNHEAEMRRCLWLSILEQDLALSISCEMPPLCPTYNLRPPANCDDAELSNVSTTDPPEHPTDRWTDGLCLNILGKNFNQRLEAYRHRFAPRSPSHFSKTMEHCRILEKILQNLPPLFKLDHTADSVGSTPGRLMAKMDLDISLRRPLIAAYSPYAKSMPLRDTYRDARLPWVQSQLIVICFQDLFDPQYPSLDVPRPFGYWDFYWTAYRYDVGQSLEAMLVEAQYLKQVEATSMDRVVNSREHLIHDLPPKVMHWDFKAMMSSIEDTLGPMTRRVGFSGGDLQSVAKYTMLYDCLRTPLHEEVSPYVISGLQGLIIQLQKRLEQEGFVLQPSPGPFGTNHEDRWLVNFLSMDG